MRIKVLLFILLSFLSIISLSGQNKKKVLLTGQVTNIGRNPIAGALIIIDGKNTGYVTDKDGIYKIKIRPDADSVTVVTFTNGISTAAINGRNSVDFILGVSGGNNQKMTADGNQVNIGYGKVSEKDLLTQVSTIDGRSSKYATYKNIYEILKGTPGVIVKGNSVQIQGQTSFNSGTEPLFVVDGMVVETVDGIPPSMVESISVLKGASASIYGSRGANGAIIINLINGSERNK
jgi:TonB-dependent SusC/RagA subfamily outer membrane receptor